MRVESIVFFILAVLVSIPVVAVEHVDTLLFPVVARTAGAGDSQGGNSGAPSVLGPGD